MPNCTGFSGLRNLFCKKIVRYCLQQCLKLRYQSAYDDDAIESSDDYGIITSMLDDITKAMENAQNAATQADESAKGARRRRRSRRN